MIDETFLTTEEVLEYLQVNLRTVYRLIKAGKIRALGVTSRGRVASLPDVPSIWDAGVPGMKVGGRRKLTIPSALAYGARGAGNVIEPHEPLVFVVDLLSVD